MDKSNPVTGRDEINPTENTTPIAARQEVYIPYEMTQTSSLGSPRPECQYLGGLGANPTPTRQERTTWTGVGVVSKPNQTEPNRTKPNRTKPKYSKETGVAWMPEYHSCQLQDGAPRGGTGSKYDEKPFAALCNNRPLADQTLHQSLVRYLMMRNSSP